MLMTSTRTCDIPKAYDRLTLAATLRVARLLCFVFILGCDSTPKNEVRIERTSYWQWQDITGRQIETAHYVIYTTVTDNDSVQRFARVMEGAFTQYASLVPAIKPDERKLNLHFFATHDEWARYTIATTGKDAEAYLSVLNGGYAVKDEFVCWLSNESDTLTTAAHEGLHQFVARYFRTRLPPTLEEGLACTFETYTFTDTVVTFNPTKNPRRQAALRNAIDGNYLIPLDTLVMIHAGDLRDRDPALRESYYAQAWALAAMLREKPTYRLSFLAMMRAAALGDTPIEIGRNDGSQLYHPDRIRPFLQRYVAPDWKTFQADYDQAVRDLADKPTTDPQP